MRRFFLCINFGGQKEANLKVVINQSIFALSILFCAISTKLFFSRSVRCKIAAAHKRLKVIDYIQDFLTFLFFQCVNRKTSQRHLLGVKMYTVL